MIMQYMGGKAKIARRVVEAILADTTRRNRWLEPFVGGGNVLEHAAPHFGRSVGMDAHPDLILMWQAVTDGWSPPDLTKDRYQELRSYPPSPERGYAGFGASFGGKWFGGYGVSPRDGEVWRASQRALARQAAVFTAHGVRFRCRLFGEYTPPPGTVVYCDPPVRRDDRLQHGEFRLPVLLHDVGQVVGDLSGLRVGVHGPGRRPG